MEKNKTEELLMEIMASWFKKGEMTNRELANFYSNYKKLTPAGLEFKLKNRLGVEEYKRIRESNIKHKSSRKYYAKRK